MGPEWMHEVKHDGWRAQLHRTSREAIVLSRRGKDLSGRFAVIRKSLTSLPPCVIDAEIVGCDADGVPDFHALTTGNAHGCCAWCFDLMAIDGKDVRREPLEERRAQLEGLLGAADADLLRFSEAFDDPEKLLAAALELGLEGSSRRSATSPTLRQEPGLGEREDGGLARGLGDVPGAVVASHDCREAAVYERLPRFSFSLAGSAGLFFWPSPLHCFPTVFSVSEAKQEFS